MENTKKDWKIFKEHGFEGIIWGGRHNPRLTLKFTDGVSVADDLAPNKDKTEYASVPIPDEWEKRGVVEVRVKLEPDKSVIHISMRGEDEPLILTMDY